MTDSEVTTSETDSTSTSGSDSEDKPRPSNSRTVRGKAEVNAAPQKNPLLKDKINTLEDSDYSTTESESTSATDSSSTSETERSDYSDSLANPNTQYRKRKTPNGKPTSVNRKFVRPSSEPHAPTTTVVGYKTRGKFVANKPTLGSRGRRDFSEKKPIDYVVISSDEDSQSATIERKKVVRQAPKTYITLNSNDDSQSLNPKNHTVRQAPKTNITDKPVIEAGDEVKFFDPTRVVDIESLITTKVAQVYDSKDPMYQTTPFRLAAPITLAWEGISGITKLYLYKKPRQLNDYSYLHTNKDTQDTELVTNGKKKTQPKATIAVDDKVAFFDPDSGARVESKVTLMHEKKSNEFKYGPFNVLVNDRPYALRWTQEVSLRKGPHKLQGYAFKSGIDKTVLTQASDISHSAKTTQKSIEANSHPKYKNLLNRF